MIFRAAIDQDRETVISLHVAISRDAYSKILPHGYLRDTMPHEKSELWRRRFAYLDDPNTQITVMEQQGEVMGFLCFQFDHEVQFGTYLHNLYVAKNVRGVGYARTLIRAGINGFSAARLEMPVHLVAFAANEPARRFYDRLGGTIIEHSMRARAGSPPIKVVRYQWQNAMRLAEAT